MSISLVDAVSGVLFGLTAILLVIGLYRAIEIRRFFVGPTYKSRVNWTAGLIIASLFFLLSSNTNIPYISWGGGVPGFAVTTLALVLFSDSGIRVAMELDFFHRDILRWRTIGRPVVILAIGSGLLSLLALAPASGNLTSDTPWWLAVGVLQYFVILAVVLSLGAAGLIIGARRTQDITMKKFVLMSGLGVACLALFFTIWIPLGVFGTDVENVGSGVFGPLAAFFIYRAVMSLSPIGRVQKDSQTAVLEGALPAPEGGLTMSGPGAI